MSNRKRKIAVIGASYLQLPVVEKAIELGIETYCFAFSEGAVCREFCTEFFPISILEKEEILKICEKLRIDGVLTIASDVAVPTVNFIAEKMGLVGNSLVSSKVCTNKYLMKETLTAQGFNVANFHSVTTADDLEKAALLRFPLIVKPVDRSGSLGVRKIFSPGELKDSFESAFEYSINKEVIVEEFIEGFEISIESISMNSSHYSLALTDKVTTGAPNFVELEHHQPSKIDGKLEKEILALIPRALSALQVEAGAAHSEIIVTKEGEIFINEIGARMGGDFIGSHLVELSTGYDYLKGVIDVALGIYNKPALTKQMHSGVVYYSSTNESYFSKINPDTSFIVEYKPPSQIKEKFLKSGDRDGYFIYQSDKKIEFDKL